MVKRVSNRLGVDVRSVRPSEELRIVTEARQRAERVGAVVTRISDGYRVAWSDGRVTDYLDESINNMVDDIYASYSDTWGADLRTAGATERAEAVRTVQAQCERVGLGFRHRAQGWSISYADRAKNYWPDDINTMVDDVERFVDNVVAVTS